MNKIGKTLTLLIVVGVCSSLAVFILGFLINSINQEYKKFTILAEELESKRGEEALLGDMRRLLIETTEERESLDQFLVKGGQEAKFIENLESRANAHGVSLSIDSVSLESGEDGDSFDTLTLGLGVSGSFGKVFNFISELEVRPLAISVPSLSLQWLGDGEGESSWRAQVEMEVLSEKNK